MPEPQLPLARHRFIRTFDVDEAAAAFGRFSTPIKSEYVDRRTPFAWYGNAIKVGSLLVGANAYGGSSFSRTEEVGSVYSMTFALAPVGGEGFDGRTRVTVKKGETAWLASPKSSSSFLYGTAYRGLNVTIPASAMEDALAVLGAPSRGLLRFDSHVALSSGPGAALQRLLHRVVAQADRDDQSLHRPRAAPRLVESILFTMLLGQPNNYSALLHATATAPGPRHVRIAAEYLSVNAGRSIRMRDLTELTGVSARALQIGFLKHRACTPMEFLRDRRLDLARAKLLEPNASVAQVAYACGFDHLGRFSGMYRARFRELPSATRRHRR